LLYYDWAGIEPNNHGGNEHCLLLDASNWWNDVNCDNAVGLTCERY
jgi:hypothetical protein